MSMGVGVQWEVRTTGSDDNGAGFLQGASGTDYSQQDSAQLALTDLAMSMSSTTLTSATGGFTSAMIGNVIKIRSGTNFDVGWYRITAYTDTNTITLDRTAASGGAGSGGSGNIGGARASLNEDGFMHDADALSGNSDPFCTIWVKSGTYTITQAINAINALAEGLRVKGYNATRGDNPTGADRPLLDFDTNNIAFSTISRSYLQFINLRFDMDTPVILGSNTMIINCEVDNSGSGNGIEFGSSSSGKSFSSAINCTVITASSAAIVWGTQSYVKSNGNSVVGCLLKPGGSVCIGKLGSQTTYVSVINNILKVPSGGSGLAGFHPMVVMNNIFFGNTSTPHGTGINGNSSVGGLILVNNIFAHLNYGVDFSGSGSSAPGVKNNTFWNCTTKYTAGELDSWYDISGDAGGVDLDPEFTDPDNDDFSPGANMKGVGLGFGSWNIGAYQEAVASGGGSVSSGAEQPSLTKIDMLQN